MSIRHTPRAALATITAVVALAAPAVLDPGMFEHESLKDGQRAAEVSAAAERASSRPFWPAAFEPVLAAASVQEHAGT
jgi:hypothetical protein